MRPLVAALVIAIGCSKQPAGHPHVDEFRAAERTLLARFNELLGQQRTNALDELGLAEAIDREVIPLWHAMRQRIDAAQPTDAERELYPILRRYLGEREDGWRAYTTALHATDDAAAKPHYANYHQLTDAATADARLLGEAFRELR